MPPKAKILAFDVGGTKIASAIVEVGAKSYKVYDYQRTATPVGKDNVINKIIEIAINYEENGGFKRIGMAIAGQIDEKSDVVKNAPNIAGFTNVNLKKIVGNKLGKYVEIDNDVKCFALAENKYGQTKKYKHVVYLTIGTGIGGAIEIDDKLYRGANNTAGEFGHMIIVSGGEECSCGNVGCWEKYVGGKALEQRYYNLTGVRKEAKDIAFDSEKNVEPDQEIIKQASLYLATGLINIVNTINPEIIVIGGSVIKSEEMLKLAIEEMKCKSLTSAKKTKIATTNMQDEAFLVGAALL